MKIAIVGASRGVGRQLIDAALDKGHEVVAIARNPEAIGPERPKVSRVRGDALDPASLETAFVGVDAVLCALGTLDRNSTVRSQGTKNAIAAAKKAGVKKLAVVSAIGVGDSYRVAQRSDFVFGRIIMPLLLKKPFADMNVMEDAVRQSGLEWTIVRPTGLSDKPAKGNVRTATGDAPVSKSIPRADVARFMVDAVESGAWAGKAVHVFG